MIRNQALAMLLASAATTTASAAMVSVDAGNYTFSYDGSYWGAGSFSQSGDVLSLSNLVANVGASTTVTSDHYRTDTSRSFIFNGGNIAVTADPGFRIGGIESGATGSVFGEPGLHPDNTRGSQGSANAQIGSSWYYEDRNGTLAYEGSISARTYHSQYRDAAGNLQPSVGMPGSFNIAARQIFDYDTTSILGQISGSGSGRVFGKESSATASIDTAFFQVFTQAVMPVPEAETWAMFLAGLGILGVIARRRKDAER